MGGRANIIILKQALVYRLKIRFNLVSSRFLQLGPEFSWPTLLQNLQSSINCKIKLLKCSSILFNKFLSPDFNQERKSVLLVANNVPVVVEDN